MLDTSKGAAMEKELFAYSLRNLYRDLERLEQKRSNKDGGGMRQEHVSMQRQHDHDYDQLTVS